MGAMKVHELAEQTTREFNKVYVRFEQVDARFEHMEDRFDQMELRFDTLREAIDARFDNLLGVLDRYAKKVGDIAQESAMLGSQASRHERWIHKIAHHNNLKLES